MSRSKNLRVSVVVPVYNDARYVFDCLSALQSQTVRPYEIIVVDNNCSDESASIAASFAGVKVIKEKNQGLSFARNRGLSAATGDLLLRIDADTFLPPTYVERLITLAGTHKDTAGFTGYGVSRYEFIPKISIPWSWGYFTFTHAYLGHPVLWGANMSIRKEYWDELKGYLINDDIAVHEDQDLSLALASVGGKVRIFRQLTVSVQMEGMLHYSQYRKYGHMLQLLKVLDKDHPRYNLVTRLPATNMLRRTLYWLLSTWGVYAFYGVTFIYSMYGKLKTTVR